MEEEEKHWAKIFFKFHAEYSMRMIFTPGRCRVQFENVVGVKSLCTIVHTLQAATTHIIYKYLQIQ